MKSERVARPWTKAYESLYGTSTSTAAELPEPAQRTVLEATGGGAGAGAVLRATYSDAAGEMLPRSAGPGTAGWSDVKAKRDDWRQRVQRTVKRAPVEEA
jgi:hypothetical protein